MTRLPTLWTYKPADPGLVDDIEKALGLSRPVAEVVARRNVHSLAAARRFLCPSLDDLANPFLLPDIMPAVERIRRAVDSGEKILVYGDRDVDGVTSISVMVQTLQSLGAVTEWYIPSDEGYGVHTTIIDRYAAKGVTLIVTVDCGISAVEETEHARKLGIDVVVTDHHEPPATGMPAALAVVDPKRSGSRYPFTDLAGCAVSFKVAEALMLSYGRYFNRTLAFIGHPAEGAAGSLSVLRSLNGIPDGEAEIALSGGAAARLAEFVGDALPVVFSRRALTAAMGKNAFPFVELFDISERMRAQVPPEIADLDACARHFGIEDCAGRAQLVHRLFRLLDRRGDLRMEFFSSSHLDAIALGTIADIMPLVSENRILVKHGLRQMAGPRRAGIRVLIERCLSRQKNGGVLSAKSISWNVTPVLNASGRRGRADLSAELMLTESDSRANDLLDEIMRLNAERRELQAENLEKFTPLLCEQCDLENDKLFIVTATGLEHGVTGIIASQIMRQYRRPTILLILEGEEAMGAARSITGFDMVGALSRVGDLLVKFGGHSQAAGLTIAKANLPEFRRRLLEIANAEITAEQLTPVVEIDAELAPEDVNMKLLNDLNELEPFGMGNPHPVFSLKGMKVREHGRIGSGGAHLKFKVSKNGGPMISAVGWGLGVVDDMLDAWGTVDLATQLEINTWQDRQSIQLSALDIRPSE